MRLKVVLLSLVLLAFLFPIASEAKHKYAEQGSYITAVNHKKKMVTITLRRHNQGTDQAVDYKMDAGCTITIDDNPVKFAKVHPGLKVIGYTESEENVLVSLDLQN